MAPLGCIRLHTQSTPDSVVLPVSKLQDPLPLRMALDVAGALSYIHSRGVLTCDLNCRDIFLFLEFRAKIVGFGGALLQGHDFMHNQSYEGRYQLPLRGKSFNDLDMTKKGFFFLGDVI